MSYSNNSNEKISSHPLPEDQEMVAKLWQDVFHDTDEFVNLFFSRVYKPENTLVIKHNDRIIAALQMVPYDIKVNNKIIPSAYVCGVCTHPSERGKGLMNKLMHEAMNEMQKKGFGITTLIPAEPWLFDFYKKFGYTQPINHSVEEYVCHQRLVKVMNTDPYTFVECTNEHFPYFDSKQRERKCTVLHNAYDFETIIRDLKHDGGSIYVALENNIPTGMAFTKRVSDKSALIKEILYDNKQVKTALYYHAFKMYDVQHIKIRIPVHSGKKRFPSEEKIYPYGLACILNKYIRNIPVPGIYMSLMLD
ncbi:MAG: GNAT family N-acetyltransferase [Tannerella sp.]|jgi:predicted acetyltransferase|nr:GNAT family N-acetyltransferase [Tannerella sp.]